MRKALEGAMLCWWSLIVIKNFGFTVRLAIYCLTLQLAVTFFDAPCIKSV
jgi:hypothetical protein